MNKAKSTFEECLKSFHKWLHGNNLINNKLEINNKVYIFYYFLFFIKINFFIIFIFHFFSLFFYFFIIFFYYFNLLVSIET